MAFANMPLVEIGCDCRQARNSGQMASPGLQGLLALEITAQQSWTAQQITEAFPYDAALRYSIRDRDGIYGNFFQHAQTNNDLNPHCRMKSALPCLVDIFTQQHSLTFLFADSIFGNGWCESGEQS
ncbi:MAG: hypothetical protein ACYTFQ_24260 [Planctomycetota bacterium]|jgi:hypothetical protein